MAVKIHVVDRVSTYPGRVELKPVSGTVYDMVRADVPIEVGTPLNKALFDQKVDGLTEDITVYVNGSSGSDSTGDGSSAAPYATIQKAIDEIPKYLNGNSAQIDIASGTYNENLSINGFQGGRLTVGVSSKAVVVRGISVISSTGVCLNIANITRNTNSPTALLYVGYGSVVGVLSPIVISGGNAAVNGISMEHGSVLYTGNSAVTVQNCGASCILANTGAQGMFYSVAGTGNTSSGLRAERGAKLSYVSKTLTATNGDYTGSGGRILTGSATAAASVE